MHTIDENALLSVIDYNYFFTIISRKHVAVHIKDAYQFHYV